MEKKKWANALWNGDFFCIETYSGLGLLGRDYAGAQCLLSAEATDKELGIALLVALSKSRELTLEEYGIFLIIKNGKLNTKSW